ncbi:MAG: hypothetical protein A2104_07505 [Candidatus Melainabacteria bacterium GWF2_32_7]|nr:MAG: hypothetical protein A2104_07505 [Candidatus Melainabacteria bacterium GWF2_32_7]
MFINSVQINSSKNYENKGNLSFTGVKNLPGLREIGAKIDNFTTVVGHEIVILHEKGKPPIKMPAEIIHQLQKKDNFKGKIFLFNEELGTIAEAFYEKKHKLISKIEDSPKFAHLNFERLNNFLLRFKSNTYILFSTLKNYTQENQKKINGVSSILGAAVEQIALDKTRGRLKCSAIASPFTKSSVAIIYLRLGLKPVDSSILGNLKRNIAGKYNYRTNIDMYLPANKIKEARKKLKTNPMIDMRYIN